MSLFTVDQEKCNRDGICVAECPGLLIEIKTKGAFPIPVAGAESRCIQCGHCVAVCPQGALSLTSMPVEACLPVRKELLPWADQVEHFLRSRRSIRSFRDKPVERKLMEKLIDIAGCAPTASNRQPVKWLVIEDKDEVKRLSGLVISFMRQMVESNMDLALSSRYDVVVADWEQGKDRISRNAPHVVVAYGSQALPSAQNDCTIALTYLELAAYSLGLGSCWAGYFRAAAAAFPPMIEALGLPEGHQVYGAMMIGYPRYQFKRIPLRNKLSILWRDNTRN